MRPGTLAAATLALVVGSATAVGTIAWTRLLPSGRSLPGSYVGGRMEPTNARLGDWLEQRRESLLAREVWARAPDGPVPVTLGELGVELDVARTMDEVIATAERGSIPARVHRALRAREGDVDVPLSFRFDRERARVWLAALAPDVGLDPIDARLDLLRHERVADEPGRELDLEGTLDAISGAGEYEGVVFEVRTREVPARVTGSMLADVDVSKVLSTFETDFAGTGEGRAVNIARAAQALNEIVVAPGAVISFNDLVGPRTLERGFAWAPVIIKDELEPGVGGGSCQAASTLHAAAVYGALDVLERRSHSRPSAYAALGLDATVVYGEVDLKVRNTYDTPLIIHAFLPTPTKLRIELLGRDPPGKVEYHYAVTRSEDFFRRITTKPWFATDRLLRRQRGIRGYDVVSWISVRGTKHDKTYRSAYRPVPEVFWVGPGFDMTTLPELPKGATRVEFDLLDPPASAPEGDG